MEMCLNCDSCESKKDGWEIIGCCFVGKGWDWKVEKMCDWDEIEDDGW